MSTPSRIETNRIESKLLEGTPLGDPAQRDLTVYLPPGYDVDPARRYPVLLAVVGFTGTGAMLFNRDPLGEDLKTRMDRLIESGACPPAVIVAPDCFTRVGGNQYINSSATGPYEDHLLQEIVPWIEEKYRVTRWGVFGKSSGGYGAMVLAMRNPDTFRATADHSGDANFELCYLAGFPEALDRYREAGGPAAWLESFWADENQHRGKHMNALNSLAMAAHYSPNPDSPHLGIDFPFDLDTGEFRADVWERWRAWDPVQMVDRYADNLRKLDLIYIDCGEKDEWALHWGARALAARIRAAGIECIHEEFDDGHRSISYRYDRSLPLLLEALSRD